MQALPVKAFADEHPPPPRSRLEAVLRGFGPAGVTIYNWILLKRAMWFIRAETTATRRFTWLNRRGFVSLDDLALRKLGDRRCLAFLAKVGLNSGEVRRELAVRLAALDRSLDRSGTRAEGDGTVTYAVGRCITRMANRTLWGRAYREVVRPESFLVEILLEADEGCLFAEILRERGIKRLDLLSLLAHPKMPAADVEPPSGDYLSVILHNDDFTPELTVTEILAEVLGVGLSRARDLTVQVHHAGKATVFEGPRETALEVMGKIQAMAVARDVPLRASALPSNDVIPGIAA